MRVDAVGGRPVAIPPLVLIRAIHTLADLDNAISRVHRPGSDHTDPSGPQGNFPCSAGLTGQYDLGVAWPCKVIAEVRTTPAIMYEGGHAWPWGIGRAV